MLSAFFFGSALAGTPDRRAFFVILAFFSAALGIITALLPKAA